MIKIFICFICLCLCSNADAALLDPNGVYNTITNEFIDSTRQVVAPIKDAARRLFWILVPIAIVLSGIKNIFKDGELSHFFYDLVMLSIISGIFLFLLDNGNDIGISIIDSLTSIVDKKQYGPSELVDLAFNSYGLFLDKIKLGSIGVISTVFVHSILICYMIVMFLIGIRFTCVFICAYVMCSVGVFVLGFGAISYTRPIAVNYLKMIFSLALELMTMIVVIDTGCQIIYNIITKAQSVESESGAMESQTYLVLLFAALFIYLISKTVPNMVGSLITSASAFKDEALPTRYVEKVASGIGSILSKE